VVSWHFSSRFGGTGGRFVTCGAERSPNRWNDKGGKAIAVLLICIGVFAFFAALLRLM
jgi:hypothetical protein